MLKPRLLTTIITVVLLVSQIGCTALQYATPTSMSTLVPTSVPLPTVVPTRSVTQLIRDLTPSIVRVLTADSQGTGFVAFGVGQVLTAFHVIGNVSTVVTVVTSDGKEYRAMVLGADEERDLALLSVPGLTAPPLVLASTVASGDTVYAIGYAAGLAGEASITLGIISAKRVDGETGIAYLQTDAAINPGNSGGPLLNEKGELVGVNVLRLRGEMAEFENMGFAISVEDVRSVIDALQAGIVRILPTANPTPTETPVLTVTADQIGEWCLFLVKYNELNKVDGVFNQRFIERAEKGIITTSEEWQQWANEYVSVYILACTLPRSPVVARSIADKLCACAGSMQDWMRAEAGPTNDYLRVNANQGRKEANDMVIDLNIQYGNPACY